MRIDNVTINITNHQQPSPFVKALLDAIVDRGDGGTAVPAELSATVSPPAIGQIWPGQGGIYAGITRGEGGQPDVHLVLFPTFTSKLAWQAGLDWAKAIEHEGHADFHVPTRTESALLYANLRDDIDADGWYWTSTQYSADSAFIQGFGHGGQINFDEEFEARVRAVRRFIA